MVTLYNPPSFYYTGWHYDYLPPLTLAIFAQMLKDAGVDAQVIDMEKLRTHPNKITSQGSDVVGFTSLTIGAKGLEDCIKGLRAKGYKGRIVVGGVHATLKPHSVLKMGADLVVTGESDGNFVDLIMGDQIGIVEGEPAPIDEIASPNWDACIPDVRTYKGQYKILKPKAGVGMWQRGCPYNCVFCGNVIYGGQKTRYRPPQKIAEEMKDLHSRGINRAYIYDDEMVGTKQPAGWMSEIANLIQPLGMIWTTQGRCSERHITLEVLSDMYRAGCRQVFWGVESLSQSVLDAIDKHTTLDDIEHTLRVSKQAGIKNCLFMMVGNYKETKADLEITQKVLHRLYKQGLVDHIQVFVAKIFPGARLEQISKQEGWYRENEKTRVWSKSKPQPTPWLSGAQIKQWQNKLLNTCPAPKP